MRWASDSPDFVKQQGMKVEGEYPTLCSERKTKTALSAKGRATPAWVKSVVTRILCVRAAHPITGTSSHACICPIPAFKNALTTGMYLG